jgi:hypothetical protein
MSKRRNVAQGARILSTGLAATGTLCLTAMFGAQARAAETTTAALEAQPANQTPLATTAGTPASTVAPFTGFSQDNSTSSTPVTTALAAPQPSSTNAATTQPDAPSATSATTPVPPTQAPLVAAPSPIVIAVPTTKPLPAPSTSSSK